MPKKATHLPDKAKTGSRKTHSPNGVQNRVQIYKESKAE